jgi:ATP-dependent Clp protease ATP-binding subunit ClpA
MLRELAPAFGFESGAPRETGSRGRKLSGIALDAVRRKFSPEFVNRIDAVVTYQPLGREELAAILDQHIEELQRHILSRLGPRGFELRVEDGCRRELLRLGTSLESGARELKRAIHRRLLQPLAVMLSRGDLEPGSRVTVSYDEAQGDLHFSTGNAATAAA